MKILLISSSSAVKAKLQQFKYLIQWRKLKSVNSQLIQLHLIAKLCCCYGFTQFHLQSEISVTNGIFIDFFAGEEKVSSIFSFRWLFLYFSYVFNTKAESLAVWIIWMPFEHILVILKSSLKISWIGSCVSLNCCASLEYPSRLQQQT